MDSPTLAAEPRPWWHWYARIPMYVRIIIGLILGLIVGYMIRADWFGKAEVVGPNLKFISDTVLRLLTAVATPLIFMALVHALVKAHITGRLAGRMMWLLMFNTVVAILVGLVVANTLQPGRRTELEKQDTSAQKEEEMRHKKAYSLKDDLLGKLPGSVLKPLAENDILGVIFIAAAAGIGLRVVRDRMRRQGRDDYKTAEALLETGMQLVGVVLHWVIALVPLAVFAVVARITGTQGLKSFEPLLWFVGAVLVALAIQAVYYMIRLRLGSWVRPGQFIKGMSDALLMAFSTASSAATMPVTFACLREKIGVREESASMGVMVGGTFNHDGTALYEAMAALFISQMLGREMGFQEQVIIVLMSVVASVGAAGIPEAGLVTMVAVFSAVGLPAEHIAMLLAVDWFLDRCRTTINVVGDATVTCMLDGTRPPLEKPAPVGDNPAPV